MSTARDALTHITGKNDEEASGATTSGKRADAGVIHSGRNGLASSGGRAYDESCVCVRARHPRGEEGTREGNGKDRGRRGGSTYCECCGPTVEPRSDLGVLVWADCPRWRA